MPVTCQICGQEFKSLITSTHLKKHNMKTAEYRETYGSDSLASPEYRNKASKRNAGHNNGNFGVNRSDEVKKRISEKNKGKMPWNVGVTKEYFSDKHRRHIEEGVARREQRFQNGEFKRGSPVDDTRRKRISHGVKLYAQQNHEELSDRAKKASQTRKDNGFNYGRYVHDNRFFTEESRRKWSEASIRYNAEKSKRVHANKVARVQTVGLTLLDDSTRMWQLQCNTCLTEFARHHQVFDNYRINDRICPKCYPSEQPISSSYEKEIAAWLSEELPDLEFEQNNRYVLEGKELDFYFPSLKIAIEFNGVYWHSENVLVKAGYSRLKDYEKWMQCKDLGVRLVTILEDEWVLNPEIVKSRIRNILGKTSIRVYARKCDVREISSKEANQFIRQTHLQGVGRSNVRYGLFYHDELVSVMTFSAENVSRKIKSWEINRFSSELGYTVVGGASKLFKRFVRDYNPESVISYSDNRWTTGKVYEQLGMVKLYDTKPNYWYNFPNNVKRYHRFAYRKNKDDDPNLTEWENRQHQGMTRIWDCGSAKYEWKRQ